MKALSLSTGRVRTFASALLLAAYASVPAAAHDREAVDQRSLTLDDVLFAGNSAQLNADGSERLDKLARFLDDYPYRVARIESSAACKASAGYDATLSERRSVAVASYLAQRGIATARLSARVSGRTEQASSSVASDCDAQSLHQNRRVLVTIENVLTSAGQP